MVENTHDENIAGSNSEHNENAENDHKERSTEKKDGKDNDDGVNTDSDSESKIEEDDLECGKVSANVDVDHRGIGDCVFW